MERWLLGEHLRKELYREEEVKNQSGFPVCPLAVAHSAQQQHLMHPRVHQGGFGAEEWKGRHALSLI